MQTFASELINLLGGTTKVARLAEAPGSTVNNMRKRLTASRLNHLRRIAEAEGLAVQVAELALHHGVVLRPLRGDGADEVHAADASCATTSSSTHVSRQNREAVSA